MWEDLPGGIKTWALISGPTRRDAPQSTGEVVFRQLHTYLAALEVQKMRISIDCWKPRLGSERHVAMELTI